MIESVRFENFKVLRDVELNGLQRLNVLVGPSGVGKTSVLEGLESWSLGNGPKGISVASPDLAPERRPAAGWDDFDEGVYAPSGTNVAPRVVRIAFEGSRLANPSPTSATPRMLPNGEGLAGMLAYLAGGYRDTLEELERHLRSIVNVTNRIRTFPVEIEVQETEIIKIDYDEVPRIVKRKKLAARFEVEVAGCGWVKGQDLSEGMLLTLGMLTILHQTPTPRTLLWDDFDKGLHPSAQAALVRTVRDVLASRPELQIIATSHSPYLLDNFQAEEVQVMTFTGEGQVAAARLDTHPEWLEWKGRLQTGEFWATVGEDWVGAKR